MSEQKSSFLSIFRVSAILAGFATQQVSCTEAVFPLETFEISAVL